MDIPDFSHRDTKIMTMTCRFESQYKIDSHGKSLDRGSSGTLMEDYRYLQIEVLLWNKDKKVY